MRLTCYIPIIAYPKDKLMQTNNSTPENDKKNVQRSASYPYYTIEDSIDFVAKVKVPFQTARFSREDASKIINKSDVSREVAAGVQYGLLEKLVGEGYKITQAALHIISPISEAEKADNIIECFKKPKLYNDLIEKYNNQALPPDSQFQVILHRFHSIAESATAHVAKVFIHNATFAGLLNKQRVLSNGKLKPVDEPLKADLPEEERQPESSTPPPQDTGNTNRATTSSVGNSSNKQPLLLEAGMIKVDIHLTGKKTAQLVYPSSINEKDIQIFELQLKQIMLSMES